MAQERSSPTARSRVSRRAVLPPALPSPIDRLPADDRIASAIKRTLKYPSESPEYGKEAAKVRDLTLRPLSDRIDLDQKFSLAWPAGFYVPSDADRTNWPYIGGTPNRYGQDWVNGSIGTGSAHKGDGSLFALASSPTTGHTIHGSVDAGVGAVYTAKHSLSRLSVQPELRLTGRHQWSVNADPVVWIQTRVTGTLFVGAWVANAASGAWEEIPNLLWGRHLVFDQSDFGSGASAMVTVPFNRTGTQAATDVLVQGGRNYLLAVVAQVALEVTTTDSAGRPVEVGNGTFDTFGSLAGLVPEIWVDETVFIP